MTAHDPQGPQALDGAAGQRMPTTALPGRETGRPAGPLMLS